MMSANRLGKDKTFKSNGVYFRYKGYLLNNILSLAMDVYV